MSYCRFVVLSLCRPHLPMGGCCEVPRMSCGRVMGFLEQLLSVPLEPHFLETDSQLVLHLTPLLGMCKHKAWRKASGMRHLDLRTA